MPNTAPYDANFTVPERLHHDRLSFTGGLVTIYASTTNPAAECPLCKQPSRRIHGCYTRTLADLPWCGTPVRLLVRVRTFLCDVPSCERRVFAERLDDVARFSTLAPPPEGGAGVDRFCSGRGSRREARTRAGPHRKPGYPSEPHPKGFEGFFVPMPRMCVCWV
jgi:hypothetical protein